MEPAKSRVRRLPESRPGLTDPRHPPFDPTKVRVMRRPRKRATSHLHAKLSKSARAAGFGLSEPKSTSPAPLDDSPRQFDVDGQIHDSPATPLRKRQIDSGSSDSDSERQPKRARLTRENLTLFETMTKKKGSSRASDPRAETTTESSVQTKTISTTSSGFAIQAYQNGILQPRHSKPPANIEATVERLSKARETASPPETRYKRYVNKVEVAPNEATMLNGMTVSLLKEYDDDGYHQVFNQAFTGFPKDVGFNDGLSAPQPDFVEGLEMREYHPFLVSKHAGGAVLYKDNPNSLALPHIAGEWKGPGKDLEEARLQSAYDGAALVYARNQALSRIQQPDPSNNAEVTTFTTDGTTINFFAHYATTSEDGQVEYHQYPITSTNLKNSYQEFKQGRRQLRNAQDYAKEQSHALKAQLKEHWKRQGAAGGGLPSITEGAPLPLPDRQPPDQDEDEPEAGYEMVEPDPLCQLIPAASSKPEREPKHDETRGSSSSSSSSKSAKSRAPPSDASTASSGKKHKSSATPRLSEVLEPCWQWDSTCSRYFCLGADGSVVWAEEKEEQVPFAP